MITTIIVAWGRIGVSARVVCTTRAMTAMIYGAGATDDRHYERRV